MTEEKKYKYLVIGYINKRDDGSEYLKLTNMTNEVMTITLQPNKTKGDSYFINKTPQRVIENNPKVPHFSKSVKVEEVKEVFSSKEVVDDIPF